MVTRLISGVFGLGLVASCLGVDIDRAVWIVRAFDADAVRDAITDLP
jgi:hypothetical protein